MDFSYDAWAKACDPPRFTVGGRTYVGRLLSHPEVERFMARFAEQEAGKLTDDEAGALVREFVDAMFPPDPVPERPPSPPFWKVRGWVRWRRLNRALDAPRLTPADLFLAMPIAAQLAAIQTFSRSLVQAPTLGRVRKGRKSVRTVGGRGHPKSSTTTTQPDAQRAWFRWPPLFQSTELQPITTSGFGGPTELSPEPATG